MRLLHIAGALALSVVACRGTDSIKNADAPTDHAGTEAVDSGSLGDADGGSAGDATNQCPIVSQPVQVGALEADEIDEASGLCASRKNAGILYVHNDSGGSARVYAMTEAGALVAKLELLRASTHDWEDMAIGPGPEPNASYLYVGDIGDNLKIRSTSIAVHRVLEPALDVNARGQTIEAEYVSLYFKYPDGPRDAETLLLDPQTSDLYFLSKGEAAGSNLYRARAPHATEEIRTLEKVAEIRLGQPPLLGSPLATSGSISPDGMSVLIRTYNSAFLWKRDAGQTIAQAVSAGACAAYLAAEPQGETIAFAADGAHYFTVSEGENAPIYRATITPR